MTYQKNNKMRGLKKVIFTGLCLAVIFTSCKKEDDPEPEIASSELHGTWVYSYYYADNDSTYTRNDTIFIDSDLGFNYSLNYSYTNNTGSGSSRESTDDDDNATWSFNESTQRFVATMPWISDDLTLWDVKVNYASSSTIILDQDVAAGLSNEVVGQTNIYTKIQ